MKILILNGPNLNQLGSRQVEHYGVQTLDEIRLMTRSMIPEVEQEWFQSNHEGELIDKIQEAQSNGFIGLVINPGGYGHTSVALHDALEACSLIKVEVHLSHIGRREPFRHVTLTGRACDTIMCGTGKYSYYTAMQFIRLKGSVDV